MDPLTEFHELNKKNIERQGSDPALQQLGPDFVIKTAPTQYSYHFSWMGRPIIQFPQDMVAMQELIWTYKPDLIFETGIAHGGSLVFYASMLKMMDLPGRVLGVDIEIRPHNRLAVEEHPTSDRIDMIEGSSLADNIVEQVFTYAAEYQKVLVILDSNHTHEHVYRELQLYSPLVRKDGYLVVFDTVVEHMPAECFPNRPWGPGNNPMTATRQFLSENNRFVVDESVHNKLLITVAPCGYLRCVET